MIAAWGEIRIIEHPSFSLARSVVRLLLLLSLLLLFCVGEDIPSTRHVAQLKWETEELFYHGFENYMKHAFPEDELRPISCTPLTRDRADPAHVELNDALGNYSLTLIDSLTTLAILASSPSDEKRNKPLTLFQDGVRDLVTQYGDGTDGPAGQGLRARGFDLDSKVQVFETAIRGLGGLLSAHLFAVGDLPIRGYEPASAQADAARVWPLDRTTEQKGIKWPNGLVYNGQLLRLAYDLGQRLLPAFWTSTGIPYPRVSLRHGAPFYANSPGNYDPELGQCETEAKDSFAEITETCSAGAGSLVLEFTVLSRLTRDSRFEDLAKRAFFAIWSRRSEIDLVGSGIDAETGIWQHPWTGIGAGIDSFFEYAYKSHILLSGAPPDQRNRTLYPRDPRMLHEPLTAYEQSSEAFLHVFDAAHAAIKRHIYRGPNYQHPHYIQVDVTTGAARAFWIDALSAYYPGLLALAGHVEEATAVHLVFTALWARFSAIPERYNMVTGGIEGGLGWWVGRPEFIESTWYLFRATEDPWYIYVGEMVLRDIQRRCYTHCGWAGIQNVLTGEKIDRMESFFLGETAKYLFLLFDVDHPLNKLDAPVVFSTEGHPLVIPRKLRTNGHHVVASANDHTCPAAPKMKPLTLSNVAARDDLYHAASLARLHLMPKPDDSQTPAADYAADHPSLTQVGMNSRSDYTQYPWTLPLNYIPHNATSSQMPSHPTFDLTFPTMANPHGNSPPLQRVKEGILINFIGGLRFSMVQDAPRWIENYYSMNYRIQSINNIALGKDEKVFIARDMGYGLLNPSDPLFTKTRDSVMLDLVVDLEQPIFYEVTAIPTPNVSFVDGPLHIEPPNLSTLDGSFRDALTSLMTQIQNIVKDTQSLLGSPAQTALDPAASQVPSRRFIPAVTSTGIGAAPIPDWPEVGSDLLSTSAHQTPLNPPFLKDPQWTKVYAADDLCTSKLPSSIPRTHQIILIKRGSCSFTDKLTNIPSVAPSAHALQLVVIVDYDNDNNNNSDMKTEPQLIRPLLEERQKTPGGLERQHGIPVVLVGGGEETYNMLRGARAVGVKRRWSVSCQGVPIDNLIVV